MPDQNLARFLEAGIRWGFRIGFDRSNPLRSAKSNHPSVNDNVAIVDKHIDDEVAAGRLVAAPAIQVSPMGLIPKKGRPGKFRLIIDLSAPKERSVNDGIDPAHCSCHYAFVADAARRVVECGQGALLAKLDLKSAYRMVPVHPDDSPLLGITWKGSTYIDKASPFGLRSAPIIFSAVADGLARALFAEGARFITWTIFCSAARQRARTHYGKLYLCVNVWAFQWPGKK